LLSRDRGSTGGETFDTTISRVHLERRKTTHP
jgi:hypothetical protein